MGLRIGFEHIVHIDQQEGFPADPGHIAAIVAADDHSIHQVHFLIKGQRLDLSNMVEVVIGQFDHIDRLLDALRQVGIRTAVQLLHYRVIVDQFLQNGFPVNRLLGLFPLVLELPAFPPVQRSPADREISLFSQLAVRLFLQDGQPLHRLFLVLHKGFSSPGPLRGIKTEIDREVPFRIFIGYTDKGIACCLHDIEEFSHTVFLTVMDELHISIQDRHRTQRNQDERVLVALET